MSRLHSWRVAALALALAAASASGEERLMLNFDPGWRFIKADPAGAQAPGFDDRAWSTVSAPHTYNDVDTFDHWSDPNMNGERDQWSGRTWYRKTFALPAAFAGRRVILEFEGVRQVAEVYVNGRLVGVGKNGFVPFAFDVTPELRFDGTPNVLAVMCDNRFVGSPGSETNLARISARVNAAIPDSVDQIQADQIPWNDPRWHPPHGGIYRNVYLHLVDPLHISLPFFSGLGTVGPYIYETGISAESARVNFEVPVQNGRAAGADVEVTAELLDAGGRAVLSLSRRSSIAAGASATLDLAGDLAQPRLWEPDYPYLYRAVLTLRVGGEPADDVTIPIGIRTARWSVSQGFFINGHHLKLHGWGQRPTEEWPGLGSALPDWMHFYTLDLMKEAGGNFIRWGHSAGAPVLIEAGDELGLIADQPGVDGESDTVRAAWKIRAAAFRDTIVFFRNHPSILIWEGGNQKVTLAHVKELRGIMDQYDPHGGRAYTQRRADQTDAKFMDVCLGTEGGHEISSLPVVEGEYDREESPRRVWDDHSPPEFGYPEAKGQTYDLTSEQYSVDEVNQYVRKIGAPWHSGGANWIFSDTTSGGRVDSEVSRASGEVDGVRLPKDAYYTCSVLFHRRPEVHIVGHWTYPAGTKKAVYVVANTGDAELFLNGRSLGHGRKSEGYLFTFPNVVWEPGELRAVACLNGQAVATDEVHTVGPPVALRMTPIAGPGGLRADGSDIALIDVEAVDARGARCPTFQRRVDFTFAGPGTWRGGYDSGKINSINNLYLDLECGINRVAVRASLVAGALTVGATCPGLRPASVTVDSHAIPLEDGFSTSLPPLPAVVLPASPPVFAAVPAEAAATSAPPPAAPGQAGRYIRNFSYSGPTTIAHVEAGAADGKNVYVDRDFAFAGLPKSLEGADWVQAGDADARYSALDFIEIAVSAGATVTVAHDDRLPVPAWLAQQFKPGQSSLTVDGQRLTLFRHRSTADESLTLGSNADDTRGAGPVRMYVVFVKGP